MKMKKIVMFVSAELRRSVDAPVTIEIPETLTDDEIQKYVDENLKGIVSNVEFWRDVNTEGFAYCDVDIKDLQCIEVGDSFVDHE